MRTDIDMAFFRDLLKRRRDELAAARDGHSASAETVELDQARVGRLSRMDALQQQAMARAADQRAAAQLRRIGAALVRINTGEYGYCLKCGEEIADKRLHVDPAAISCMICARLAEGR